MGAHSPLKEKYDEIASHYFEKQGYEIVKKGGGGGAFFDVVARKGSITALVEVKSPAETVAPDYSYQDMGEEQYLGGIRRKNLLDLLSPLLEHGIISLTKLYIATIYHEMYHAYLKYTQSNAKNNIEFYLCTPVDNERLPNVIKDGNNKEIEIDKLRGYLKQPYEVATEKALRILQSIGLIKLESKDKYCEGDCCIGIYKVLFHEMPKEQTEENIKKRVEEFKKSKLPSSHHFRIPFSKFPSHIPFPSIPIEPKTMGIIAGVIVVIIIAWWLYSHFSWTKDKAASVTKKEEPVTISTPTTIPEPPSLPSVEPVYFQFDKSNIDSEVVPSLISLAEELKKLSVNFIIDIEGYTCKMGSPSYNLSLSENRANAVKSLLIAKDISPNYVRVHARGIVPDGNETKEGRIKNRRANISISIADVITSDAKPINMDK